MVRIGIVEDNRKLGDELKSKIELSPNFQVKFVKPNGKELLHELAISHAVDVIFMDIEMPIMDGITSTEKVSKLYPEIKIIMCSIYEDEDSICDALHAGAKGYILKEENPLTIHQSILDVMNGGSALNPIVAKKTIEMVVGKTGFHKNKMNFGLTIREKEVLLHLSNGLSYDQIGNSMYISNGTVRKHIEHLYRKLGVNNKVDAINKLDSIA